MPDPRLPPRWALLTAVVASGVSGLTWEVLWQFHTGLALGVSAFGTAVTLAAMMAGLGLGGLFAARLARSHWLDKPLAAYGAAEIAIGCGGLAVAPGLAVLGSLDASIYAASPAAAKALQIGGTTLLLLIPACAMGLTIPILAPLAQRIGTNVAVIYSLNIAGAVAGTAIATFAALPMLGVRGTGIATAGVNLVVGIWAFGQRGTLPVKEREQPSDWPGLDALGLAAASGFVIFVLEVSWFRSLRALLQATTESFAIILATFLLALTLGGVLAAQLRRRRPEAFSALVPLAALGVVAATPLVDSLDQWALHLVPGWTFSSAAPAALFLRFALVFCVLALPVILLGTIFPWLLADHPTTSGAGRLTAVNTVGAVGGSLLAGFVLLPTIGATWSSCLAAGVLLGVASVRVSTRRGAFALATTSAVAAAALLLSSSPADRLRARGIGSRDWPQLHYLEEGPDSTVAAVGTKGGRNALIIDGFMASGEGAGSEYMPWMGHLPALAARRLDHALVICSGAGQTANAVRQHGPASLELVDISAAVFRAAPYFASNQGVLDDPAVHATVMDGRAYLRRTDIAFDLVTLEPMAPNFAGTNNLYSLEFYELIRARLAPGGVVAQWFPYHLIAPEHMLAMTAAFQRVFPYSRIWISPGTTGIIVGGVEPWDLRESKIPLPLPQRAIEQRFALDYDAVAEMVHGVEPVTDDNQLLSYGYDRLRQADGNWSAAFSRENREILRARRRATRSVP